MGISTRDKSPAVESSMELLNHPAKMGTSSRHASISSFPQRMESIVKSVGRPTGKSYYTWRDLLMVVLSLVCFFLAVLTIVYAPTAAALGQKNQLIVIGFLLSLMAVCLQKQAQLLLITLEARFGASTLQNYDSILRSSMLDSNVSVLVKVSLMLLFALPLGLSASYKQFVNGITEINLKTRVLDFGPVGPPGLADSAMAMTVNASLPVFNTSTDQVKKIGNFGFNTAVISENFTAMLDAPLPNNLTSLQNSLEAGESLWISSYVNATICTMNSTYDSPERNDPDYWKRINDTFIDPPSITDYGTGEYFGMVSGYADWTLVFLSWWDANDYPDEIDYRPTFYTEAIGFNLYRGQCNATWQISRVAITLEDASDCTKAPKTIKKPCEGYEPSSAKNFSHVTGPDLFQTPITCNQMDLSHRMVYPFFDMLEWTTAYQPVSPVWVTSVASMVWAQISSLHGPTSWALTSPNNASAWDDDPYTLYPWLKYRAPVTVTKTVQTLHQSRWPLYLVLAIQPILLLIFFLARVMLYATPVTSGFGLIALLAGVSRESTEILRGAAFSGELKKPVRMKISVSDVNERDHVIGSEQQAASVEYELNASGRHGRVRKRMVYG